MRKVKVDENDNGSVLAEKRRRKRKKYKDSILPIIMRLSRRDFFAAAAIQGLLSNPVYNDVNVDGIAEISRRVADVLLEELGPCER